MATLVQDILRIGENGAARIFHRKQFLNRFNDTARAYPDKCVHELFERQVERSPEAIAVVSGPTQFSYRELNARANQLARFLKRFGVGPDSLVGLCVDRSPEMVIGILGILKAGASYVPMDPSYPTERLSFMLKDANVFVLLTQAHLLDALPQHNGPRLSLDSDWDIVAKERIENLSSRATPANLAYVIYTSGSTGQPKGVMIRHRKLSELVLGSLRSSQGLRRTGALVDLVRSHDN
jgi:non-ribosomal peptide synthetase component F